MDPDALVPMALCGNHHIGLIQHEHGYLFGVDELVFDTPVEDCAWCSNDNVFFQLDTTLHCEQSDTAIKETVCRLKVPFSVGSHRLRLLLFPRMA